MSTEGLGSGGEEAAAERKSWSRISMLRRICAFGGDLAGSKAARAVLLYRDSAKLWKL